MIGSTRSLQHAIHCIIYTGLFIAIWIRTCNGMPVDISMERLSETFIPLESSETSEVRRILNFIAALGKPKNIIFWLVLIVSLQLTT